MTRDVEPGREPGDAGTVAREPGLSAKGAATLHLPKDSPPSNPPPPPPEISVSGSGAAEFKPGDVLSERYRIIRFIARGGMGEVYEAEDLALHGHLALKTIRPEIAKDATAVERFKREIAVARRITHPNISRIYDLGIHHGAADTMFLTMEFLAGETLRDRIVRGGRMSEAEAIVLADQIAAGLAAAHDCGIIHRDFKSANVMLVPGGNGKSDKAVVTDFGLARPVNREEGMITISGADAVVGTPAYMAPEQVTGGRLTQAADLYAFGVVLYEMITARRPFEGDTPLSTAVKRLTEPPSPPIAHVPSLNPVWNAVLLRCLARDPADRYASALDVSRALHSGDVPTAFVSSREVRRMTSPETVPVPSVPKRRPVFAIAAAVAVVAIAILGFLGIRAFRSPGAEGRTVAAAPSRASVPLRRSVAVLGLRNSSGRADAAWLAGAISEMLTTELSADGKLRVSAGEEVARVKSDLGLNDPENVGAEALARIRKTLGADSVVVGSYTLVGEPNSGLLRIDVRAVDTATGRVLASTATSGTETQLFDLVSRAGGGIRQKLGVGDLTSAQAVEVEASVPAGREAMRLYTEGVQKLRLLDAAGARDLLLLAANADSKHALTRSALSSAYSSLGYTGRAREAASEAVALSNNLGREQKLQIEARSFEASSDWARAADVHRSLHESFPDNLDYGLNLASALISAGRTREALVAIDQLRVLPPPLSSDARIDLVAARANQELGEFQKQKTLATAAAAKARSNGSRLLLARARMLEASALLTLGDLQGTAAAADEARSLFEAAGDRGSVARALEFTATCVSQQGDIAGERRLLEQALALHREVGDQGSVARVLLNIGTGYLAEGRQPEAKTLFDQALATFRQTGAKFAAATTLNDIGGMLFNSGDLVGAQERYQGALTLFGELGNKTGTAHALTNIAEVLGCRGDLEEARKMHEDSLAINRAIGDKAGIAYDLFRLGEIFVWRGDLVAARDRYDEALKLQMQVEDKLGAADTRVALAEVAILQGKAAEGDAIAREAEEILRTEGAAERGYFALTVIADSLLAQGKQKEAREIADRAWKLAENCEDRRIRFAAATTMARVKAASGNGADVDSALSVLEATRAEAAKKLFFPSELEARLAIGEIEAAAGRPAGKRHLTALERDAKARSFGLIARRAART